MNDAAQANNPLLRAKAFNMHDYYVGNLTDVDEDANQFWLRFCHAVLDRRHEVADARLVAGPQYRAGAARSSSTRPG